MSKGTLFADCEAEPHKTSGISAFDVIHVYTMYQIPLDSVKICGRSLLPNFVPIANQSARRPQGNAFNPLNSPIK